MLSNSKRIEKVNRVSKTGEVELHRTIISTPLLSKTILAKPNASYQNLEDPIMVISDSNLVTNASLSSESGYTQNRSSQKFHRSNAPSFESSHNHPVHKAPRSKAFNPSFTSSFLLESEYSNLEDSSEQNDVVEISSQAESESGFVTQSRSSKNAHRNNAASSSVMSSHNPHVQKAPRSKALNPSFTSSFLLESESPNLEDPSEQNDVVEIFSQGERETNIIWTTDKVKYLLAEVRKYQEQHAGKPRSHMYKHICEALIEDHIFVAIDPKQVENKCRRLERSFKQFVDDQSKT